jgi:hypothetical protein
MDNFLVYGIFRPIQLLTEIIFEKAEMIGEQNKKLLLMHYLRNIIAFHVFNIYQMYGMRVRVPENIYKEAETYANWLNIDFLNCKFLKKGAPGADYTATNIPFILTIIVLMIKKNIVLVHCKPPNEDCEPKELKKMFHYRQGYIHSIREKIKTRKDATIKQDDLWYMKHVKLVFTSGMNSKGEDKVMDLEELFTAFVFGLNPFVVEDEHVGTEKNIQTKAREDHETMRRHFNRLRLVEKEITFEDIFNTLKMESKVDKTTKAKAEEISGWLSAAEMKDMLQIVNQKENPDDDLSKREMLQNELVKQQSIALAKAANIGLHLSLWNESEEDDNLWSSQTKVVDPLKNLKIVNEASLHMLKNPGRKSTTKFPPVLNSVQEELQKGANKLSRLCRTDNCDYWTDTAMAFSELSKKNIVPSHKRWKQFVNDEKAMLEETKPTLPGLGVASSLPQIPRIPVRKSDPVSPLDEDLIMPLLPDSKPTATPSSQGHLATSQNPPPVVDVEKEKHPTVEVPETKPIETPTTPTKSVVEQLEVVPPLQWMLRLLRKVHHQLLPQPTTSSLPLIKQNLMLQMMIQVTLMLLLKLKVTSLQKILQSVPDVKLEI